MHNGGRGDRDEASQSAVSPVGDSSKNSERNGGLGLNASSLSKEVALILGDDNLIKL